MMRGNAGTRVIKPFDPWRGRLCTCPRKFSFDPYTGCEHGCLYCYASSYIRRFHECRPKKNLLELVEGDVLRLPENALISMSNSSDPYPPMEYGLELTRRCLNEFRGRNLRILVITKSDLVLRDLDILRALRCAVTLTITTLDDQLAGMLEPGAPPPSRRLHAVERLSSEGIRVGVRIDPIIPYINDEGINDLLREIRDAGAIHVTSSTFKPRPDSWARIEAAFPDVAERLRPLYFEKGERIARSRYLPKPMRFKLMKMIARRAGLEFSTVMAVNKLNYMDAAGYTELAEKAGADCACMIPTMPVGRAGPDIAPSPDQLISALRAAESAAKSLGYWIAVWCYVPGKLVIDPKFISTWSDCRRCKVLDIDPAGNLLLCDILDIRLSNVKKGFRNALSEYLKSREVKEVMSPRLRGPCKSCKLAEICMGGCYARSYLAYGTFDGPDPYCPRAGMS